MGLVGRLLSHPSGAHGEGLWPRGEQASQGHSVRAAPTPPPRTSRPRQAAAAERTRGADRRHVSRSRLLLCLLPVLSRVGALPSLSLSEKWACDARRTR